MKRTIPTAAALMVAILFARGAAQAQSATADKAWPPGPSGQAAALSATNVNVVNAPTVTVGNSPTVTVGNTPTVTVGNQVTVKDTRQPIYIQETSQFLPGTQYGSLQFVVAPGGSRMTIENISLWCNSGSSQLVVAAVFRAGIDDAILTMAPAPLPWGGAGSYSSQTLPVHLLVDDSLTLLVYRGTTSGQTDCAVTFIGYTTPLPQP